MSHRMQLTLGDHQYEVLLDESRQTGASIAELVRQALDEHFGLAQVDDRSERFRQALAQAAGSWTDRDEDGAAYQRRIRAPLARRSGATSLRGTRRRSS